MRPPILTPPPTRILNSGVQQGSSIPINNNNANPTTPIATNVNNNITNSLHLTPPNTANNSSMIQQQQLVASPSSTQSPVASTPADTPLTPNQKRQIQRRQRQQQQIQQQQQQIGPQPRLATSINSPRGQLLLRQQQMAQQQRQQQQQRGTQSIVQRGMQPGQQQQLHQRSPGPRMPIIGRLPRIPGAGPQHVMRTPVSQQQHQLHAQQPNTLPHNRMPRITHPGQVRDMTRGVLEERAAIL